MMNFCTSCGTRLVAGLRFCTSCGAPLSATPVEPSPIVEPSPVVQPPLVVEPPPVEPPPVVAPPPRVDLPPPTAAAPSHRAATTDEQILPGLAADRSLWTTDEADPVTPGHGSHRGVPAGAVVAITVVLLAGLVAIAVHALSSDPKDSAKAAKPSATVKPSEAPPSSDQPTKTPSPEAAAAAVVGKAVPGLPAGEKDVASGADITAPPSSQGRVDAKGRPATYPPKAMLDTDPSTAWRMDGDGSGQVITVSFGRRVTVTGLALDPGFDKTGANEDRWKQNRRISAATFTTDDGSAFTVSFATKLNLPVRDRLQSFVLPAPVQTSTLRVHIDATDPMPPHAFDTTAISRLAVLGS